MIILPAFSLLKRQSRVPHVARVVATARIANQYGAVVEYKVWCARGGSAWWIAASCDGYRVSNTLSTRLETRARAWIAAVEAGAISISDE